MRDIKAIYHIVKLSGASGHEATLAERAAAGVGNADGASGGEGSCHRGMSSPSVFTLRMYIQSAFNGVPYELSIKMFTEAQTVVARRAAPPCLQ